MQYKKILLAVGVLGVFLVYTFVIRHQGSGAVITPPQSLKNTTSGSSSTSGSTAGSSNSSSSGAGTSATPTSSYKDGTYTGSVTNAYYGNVQVQATIKNGKITDVEFLQYPSDNPNSQYINSQATPYLKQEAIQAQSAQVDLISGATLTSQAFTQSLSSALSQAQA
jgi:uncharacterized protein with FMN-binding domain